jgi:deoxyribodipyrimidine photo-lyase
MIQQERVNQVNFAEFKPFENGTIIYWITREHRVEDNWSLIYAYNLAVNNNQRLLAVINLNEESNIDYVIPYNFFIEGLEELQENFLELNIPLYFNNGKIKYNMYEIAQEVNASAIITDLFPLRYYKNLISKVASNINIPIYEVDSHNIVPIKIASNKLEFAAYTIRPKVNKNLPSYLIEFPKIGRINNNDSEFVLKYKNRLNELLKSTYNTKNSIKWLKPGTKAGNEKLEEFISNRLSKYAIDRNNPLIRGISDLSPYFHFGFISTQRVALEITKLGINNENNSSFLEEMIVRRELSDNFCYYNSNYDNFDGIHDWAKKTLNEHRADKRQYTYSLEEFELAKTHDNAWNAAQKEMVLTGKMHGYMRMYWAKKILEWTKSPEEAIAVAIYLNDKYELDGYDPNGYVGVMWSIGGVHDRAWNERAIFGKIRFMNYDGLKRKMKIGDYEAKWNSLAFTSQSLF